MVITGDFPGLRTGAFCLSKVLLPADSNESIWIREKMLEFSPEVLPVMSLPS